MRLISIILLALFLQGCNTIPEIAIPADKPVNISKEALEPCSLLKENLAISSFEDAIVAYGDLSTAYGTCANKQFTSIKLLKQFGNIK